MINVSRKFCLEYQNPNFVFNNTFSENRSVHEIVWKNTVEQKATDNIKGQGVCFAFCITKARNKISEYLIIISC